MTTLHDDYETLANQRLIAQMARYYNSARLDIEIYREMNATVLEEMAAEHLAYWKRELHTLIFNGLDTTKRSQQ
jgi:hypothetical protein